MMNKTEDGYKTVQELGEELGISRRTIQYYDNIGLLPATKRSSKGYRLYDEATVSILRKVLKYKDMGFELKEIKELINNPSYNVEMAFIKRREVTAKELEEIQIRLNSIDDEIECIISKHKGD